MLKAFAYELKFTESVAVYSFASLAGEDGISKRGLDGLRSFRAAWDMIDRLSPYAIRDRYG